MSRFPDAGDMMPTILQVAEMLMPLFPFFFVLLYLISDNINGKIMFGVFGATTAIFMSFEIATSLNWLALVYFMLGIGLLAMVLTDYTRHMASEVKKK